ncbi:hypothetical protein D1AOALGA4SA_12160 [Olavius algarvensis Delta 1 endosymbiont]|nr:hypothetical protein D1AOALGA4SA_12160 [Olavius algarvensis Delta 1 endosymbiont]
MRRLSANAAKIAELRETDVGRPFNQLSSNPSNGRRPKLSPSHLLIFLPSHLLIFSPSHLLSFPLSAHSPEHPGQFPVNRKFSHLNESIAL